MRDIGKKQADREMKREPIAHNSRAPSTSSNKCAGRQFYERALRRSETLADAAQPLFASLNDQQKRRLTEELVHIINERDVN